MHNRYPTIILRPKFFKWHEAHENNIFMICVYKTAELQRLYETDSHNKAATKAWNRATGSLPDHSYSITGWERNTEWMPTRHRFNGSTNVTRAINEKTVNTFFFIAVEIFATVLKWTITKDIYAEYELTN